MVKVGDHSDHHSDVQNYGRNLRKVESKQTQKRPKNALSREDSRSRKS
jgi:hypothetical protein